MRKHALVLMVIALGAFPSVRSAAVLHPFHTSITQIDYDPKTQVFEVSLRVFTDDFETALAREGNQPIKLDETGQHDALIEGYLRKQFGFTDPAGLRKAARFIGKEFEVEATWIYLEVPCPPPVSGLRLRNALLTEVFEDQVNVVNFTYLSAKRTYLFKADNALQPLD
ncbi:MAG: hypothetical protein H7Z75_06780 [Ferruginibacter sp.]|nr:hypothetical protein [Cytophagales bacterium]